jgi:hypothetical protein
LVRQLGGDHLGLAFGLGKVREPTADSLAAKMVGESVKRVCLACDKLFLMHNPQNHVSARD